MSTCEFETPCPRVIDRDPWCVPCLNSLIDQQQNLNERLNDENERLTEDYRKLRTVTDEKVEAAAGILRPNGYDVPAATLRRALLAALIDVE